MRYLTALLTLFALGTGVVFAHAELSSSTPNNAQTVNTAPTAVDLVFSEGVDVDFSIFKVYPLPDAIAAQEADAALYANTMPLDDNDDSMDDNDTSHDDDMNDDMDDDHNDDDHGADSNSADSGSSDLAAFVSSVLDVEGDEAERVDNDVSSQGSQITIALTDGLKAGWYVVMWSALSDDEHPVEGYVTFNYQP